MDWSEVGRAALLFLGAMLSLAGVIGGWNALGKKHRVRSRLQSDASVLAALPSEGGDAVKMGRIVSHAVAELYRLEFPTKRDRYRWAVRASFRLDIAVGVIWIVLAVMVYSDWLRPDRLSLTAVWTLMTLCTLELAGTQLFQFRAAMSDPTILNKDADGQPVEPTKSSIPARENLRQNPH